MRSAEWVVASMDEDSKIETAPSASSIIRRPFMVRRLGSWTAGDNLENIARPSFALFKVRVNRLDKAMKTLLCCLTIITLAGSTVLAQSPLELQSNDTMHAVLERQVGK